MLVAGIVDGITNSNRESDAEERIAALRGYFDAEQWFDGFETGLKDMLALADWPGEKQLQVRTLTNSEGRFLPSGVPVIHSARKAAIRDSLATEEADAVFIVTPWVTMSPDFEAVLFGADLVLYPATPSGQSASSSLPDPLFRTRLRHAVYEIQATSDPEQNVKMWLENEAAPLKAALNRGRSELPEAIGHRPPPGQPRPRISGRLGSPCGIRGLREGGIRCEEKALAA